MKNRIMYKILKDNNFFGYNSNGNGDYFRSNKYKDFKVLLGFLRVTIWNKNTPNYVFISSDLKEVIDHFKTLIYNQDRIKKLSEV